MIQQPPISALLPYSSLSRSHYNFAHNPSLNPGPALKSATHIPGLRQLQCLTSIVLPLSIIIATLPFSLPLHLCPKSLSQLRACPQECNQYPRAETTTVPYLNSITSKHYNNSVTFQLTITPLPSIPLSTPGLPSRAQPISPPHTTPPPSPHNHHPPPI